MNYKAIIESMQTSRVRNYIIPGLNSYLLGDGKVRMFESTREFAGTVTPHSHRFDFACHVLSGTVINRLYHKCKRAEGDDYTVRTLQCDEMGTYSQVAEDQRGTPFKFKDHTYREGDWYQMSHDQIHSIQFGKGAKVIFFEGATVQPHSQVLLPFMHGETIETMECDKDWMYLRDD